MNNENTKTNKVCFYWEVLKGTYDCNYCGENLQCYSSECCYAFEQRTKYVATEDAKIETICNIYWDWYKDYYKILCRETNHWYDSEDYEVKMEELIKYKCKKFVESLIIYEKDNKLYPEFIENYCAIVVAINPLYFDVTLDEWFKDEDDKGPYKDIFEEGLSLYNKINGVDNNSKDERK